MSLEYSWDIFGVTESGNIGIQVEQRVEVDGESAYIRRCWSWSGLSLKRIWSWWIWHPLCCVFEKSEFLGFLRVWEPITLSNGRLLCEHLTVCGGGRLDRFTYSHFESQLCANSIAKSFKNSFWELALRKWICNTSRELFEWLALCWVIWFAISFVSDVHRAVVTKRICC